MTESRSRSTPDPKCMHCWVSLESKLPYWTAAEKRFEFPIGSKKALATDNYASWFVEWSFPARILIDQRAALSWTNIHWCEQISRPRSHSRPRLIELYTIWSLRSMCCLNYSGARLYSNNGDLLVVYSVQQRL